MKKLALIFVFLSFFSANAEVKTFNRIVSLSPSVTEILFALGVGTSVVGVTNFCDWPLEVKDIKKIGGMTNPSIELVVASKPDLVVLTEDGNPPELLKRFKDLNINTYVFKAKRIKDLSGEIKRLAVKLGVEKNGVELSSSIESDIKEITSGNNFKDLKVVYIVWPDPLIVAGESTVINDALELLGLDNIAKVNAVQYPRYSIESLLLKDPHVIFIGNHSMTRSPAKKLLKKLTVMKAVIEGRVLFIGDALHRLGPRTSSGIKELSESLKTIKR